MEPGDYVNTFITVAPDSSASEAFASGVSPFDGSPVKVTPAMRSSRR